MSTLLNRKSLCETKLIQILNKDPTLINLLIRDLPHPLKNLYEHIPLNIY